MLLQVVEELFTYWNLDQTDDELEQLEELLIVSPPPRWPASMAMCMRIQRVSLCSASGHPSRW